MGGFGTRRARVRIHGRYINNHPAKIQATTSVSGQSVARLVLDDI